MQSSYQHLDLENKIDAAIRHINEFIANHPESPFLPDIKDFLHVN